MTDRDTDASTVGSDEEQPPRTSSGYRARGKRQSKAGAYVVLTEDDMHQYIQSLVDDAHGIMVKEAHKQPGRTAATLCSKAILKKVPEPSKVIGLCTSNFCMTDKCPALRK